MRLREAKISLFAPLRCFYLPPDCFEHDYAKDILKSASLEKSIIRYFLAYRSTLTRSVERLKDPRNKLV
jgi:hypothetical protein